MHQSIKIFHNPRCSKSRQTLELIRQQGIEPEVIEYLKTPPTISELKDILTRLNMEPRQLMRTKEAEYKENNLDSDKLSNEELIKAMVKNPKLIERPIVINHQKVALGRPPENVLEIL